MKILKLYSRETMKGQESSGEILFSLSERGDRDEAEEEEEETFENHDSVIRMNQLEEYKFRRRKSWITSNIKIIGFIKNSSVVFFASSSSSLMFILFFLSTLIVLPGTYSQGKIILPIVFSCSIFYVLLLLLVSFVGG